MLFALHEADPNCALAPASSSAGGGLGVRSDTACRPGTFRRVSRLAAARSALRGSTFTSQPANAPLRSARGELPFLGFKRQSELRDKDCPKSAQSESNLRHSANFTARYWAPFGEVPGIPSLRSPGCLLAESAAACSMSRRSELRSDRPIIRDISSKVFPCL